MPTFQNPFKKNQYSKQWVSFYCFFAFNMVIFILIAFMVEPIWYDINYFLIDALGIQWNWLVSIIVISFFLFGYGVFLSIFYIKKGKKAGGFLDTAILLSHKLIPLPFFLGWNFMLWLLIDEGGSELIVIRTQLEFISPIIYIVLLLAVGFLMKPSIDRIKKISFQGNKGTQLKKFVILFVIIIGNLVGILLPLLLPPVNAIRGELPDKPKIMGHRGASHLSPENTLSAGRLAAEWGCVGWEVDISISYDGVLFLMHDNSLQRTTNVEDIFPERTNEDATMFNISELRQLNAGTWFVEQDPYNTIKDGYVSDEDVNSYIDEKIPLFSEVLNLTGDYDLFIDIDGGRPPEGHPYRDLYWEILLAQLNASGLGKKIMINSANKLAQNMTKVGKGKDMINTHHGISNKELKSLEEEGVIVMVWTVDSPKRFTQLWCLGVDYVKTNAVHLLIPMKKPSWVISYDSYLLIWGITSVVSITLGIIRYLLKKK